MTIMIVVLRALHILGGVFWAGASMTMHGFVMPSVKATLPDSGKFVQRLSGMSGLAFWMTLASAVSVAAGLALASPLGGGIAGDMRSPSGMTLAAGMLVGLLVFLEGQLVSAPTARKLGGIARAVAAAGAPPTPDQLTQMEALRSKLQRVGVRGAWMLGTTVTLMAIARYM